MTFEPSRSGRIQPRSEREKKKINSLRDAVDFQGVLQMKRFPLSVPAPLFRFLRKKMQTTTHSVSSCVLRLLSHVMSFFCLRMFLFYFPPCPPPSSRPRRRCPASRFVTRRTDKETRCRSRHIWAQGDGLRGADVFTCLLSCFFFPCRIRGRSLVSFLLFSRFA
jgi:hypothetical protein